jgi:hypothetical protein
MTAMKQRLLAVVAAVDQMGSWTGSNWNMSVQSANAFTSPSSSGVAWHDMVTVSLGGTGTIDHIIDGNGGTVNSSSTVANLTSYN